MGVDGWATMSVVFRPCGASHFLLLRQKKVSKEKATPGRCPLRGFPALLETPGGLPELACGSDKASRRPPAFLRCSAPSKGPGKASGTEQWLFVLGFSVTSDRIQFCAHSLSPRRLSGPHVERRATQALAEKGRGLSEGQRPEFRSPRQCRVAQGSRQRRPRNLGSPFLWLLSFGEAKESMPAPQGRKTAAEAPPSKPPPQATSLYRP